VTGFGLVNKAAIKGLIFDLDGVLIHSRAAHAKAFEEVFAGFGITGFDYGRFAGWRTDEVVAAVFAEHPHVTASLETIGECADRKSRRARELLSAGDHIAEGCTATLERLSRRYSISLASSGSRASVEAFLSKTGLRSVFRCVLAGEDVKRAKPHPEIFRRSIRALGLPPECCVVIEDAAAGVEAALCAGACVVGIAGEHPELLLRAGADCVVRSLSELEGLLT